MTLVRVGAVAAIAQGLALLGLTFYFGVLFPSAGLSSPSDFGDPAKYLPVVVAHPSWFVVPAWLFGLVPDVLFAATLVALRERLRPVAHAWADLTVLVGTLALAIYLMGHAINVAWTPELVAEVARSGDVVPHVAAQYVVVSRIYDGAMTGGTALMGVALLLMAAIIAGTRCFPRGLAVLAMLAGLCDLAAPVAMLPPALPLTGVVTLWLGLLLLRTRDASA